MTTAVFYGQIALFCLLNICSYYQKNLKRTLTPCLIMGFAYNEDILIFLVDER